MADLELCRDDGVREWIGTVVDPVSDIEVTRQRAWGTVMRVPIADGVAWFKSCGRASTFEPSLSARLFQRWPDRVCEVIAHDEERSWLLLVDAGLSLHDQGTGLDQCPDVLARYAELQMGEVAHVTEHLAKGVPDTRLSTMSDRFQTLVASDLPIEPHEHESLRGLEDRFVELCNELDAAGIPDTIQHDDLHARNVYQTQGTYRVMDWGDCSISHPFISFVATLRYLVGHGIAITDAALDRLRDAYLEPWGRSHRNSFDVAMRLGTIAHAFGWLRHRTETSGADRAQFDVWFARLLRDALAQTG